MRKMVEDTNVIARALARSNPRKFRIWNAMPPREAGVAVLERILVARNGNIATWYRSAFCLFTALVLLINIIPAFAANPSGQADRKATQSSQDAIKQENGNMEKKPELPDYIKKSEYRFTVIDPTPSNNPLGAYYPGLRAGNQLNIYTPKFGERTGTNEYGREAVVVNGVVTSLTGGNSLIPKDGFVISGHGRARDWINKNLTIGAFITINPENNTIESTISPESYIFKAKQNIIDVKQTISEYKKILKGYSATESKRYLEKAEKSLNAASKSLKNKDFYKVDDQANTAASLADQALYNAIPAKEGEFHGIWIRPVEKTSQEVGKTLDRIKSAGIDNVFLETYYQGYTIFPSKTLESYGVLPQKAEFKGWDPLKVWMDEAHERGMKLHVWFQTFYVGNEDISKNPKHVLSAHPAWANVQRRNALATMPMPSRQEHNGYFLDPANPEVHTYLTSLISEIVNNYNIDGLNIDYIRYPASLPGSFPSFVDSTWGYSNFARSEFMSLNTTDPINLTLEDPLWQKWNEYRQSKVSGFVASLKPIVKDKRILISTVIFPDPEESCVTKQQNWSYWGNQGYADAFTPLVMGSDEFLVESYVKEIINTVGNKVSVYPGLFEPFAGGSPSDLLHQVKTARSAGASGIMIFDYAHLNKDFITAVSARAFKNTK